MVRRVPKLTKITKYPIQPKLHIKPRDKMSGPQLTAIVSVYNSSKFLQYRLDNLFDTNYYKQGKLLIYLVNASSPDINDNKLCEQVQNHTNVIYETIPFCTVYAAWNHAILKTSTPFITNANTDDLIAPDGYDQLVDACINHNTVISYCGWYDISKPTKWNEIDPSNHWTRIGQYNPEANQLSCSHFPVWSRKIHDVVGLFDPDFKALGDADLWFRCWKAGLRNLSLLQAPIGAYCWKNGQNLWHTCPEESRSAEWSKLYSRSGEKLYFNSRQSEITNVNY